MIDDDNLSSAVDETAYLSRPYSGAPEPGCLIGLGVIGSELLYLIYVAWSHSGWSFTGLLISAGMGAGACGLLLFINEVHTHKLEAEARQSLASQTEVLINDLKKKIAGLLTESLFIDANIWMMNQDDIFLELPPQSFNGRWEYTGNPPLSYDSRYLFSDFLPQVCRESDYVISLPSWQFDEICNVKKKSNYKKNTNKRSRVAIGRIEELQKMGLLKIDKITLDAKSAYADPLIIQGAVEAVKSGRMTTVVTNDKELRIRLRQHLEDTGLDNWQVVGLQAERSGDR